MNKAKITRIGTVENGKPVGWQMLLNSGHRIVLGCEDKDLHGYTLDELREISENKIREWLLTLPFDNISEPVMMTEYECDGCGRCFDALAMYSHFPHRKENMKEKINEIESDFAKRLDQIANQSIAEQTKYSRENFDDFGNFKPKTALRIKFIKLESALVMQVLEQDNEALGIKEQHVFGEKNGYGQEFKYDEFIIDAGQLTCKPMLTESSLHLIGAEAHKNIVSVLQTPTPTNDLEFLKLVTNAFAANNAFHGVDKPVPRIETGTEVDELGTWGTYWLYWEEHGQPLKIFAPQFNALQSISGCSIPLYSPKPKFSSSWEKVSPREFKREDIKQFINLPSLKRTETDDVNLVKLANALGDVMNETIADINKLNTAAPETWIFTMKTI